MLFYAPRAFKPLTNVFLVFPGFTKYLDFCITFLFYFAGYRPELLEQDDFVQPGRRVRAQPDLV